MRSLKSIFLDQSSVARLARSLFRGRFCRSEQIFNLNGFLEESSSPEPEYDLLTFTKSKLQSAEVKGLQEEAREN